MVQDVTVVSILGDRAHTDELYKSDVYPCLLIFVIHYLHQMSYPCLLFFAIHYLHQMSNYVWFSSQKLFEKKNILMEITLLLCPATESKEENVICLCCGWEAAWHGSCCLQIVIMCCAVCYCKMTAVLLLQIAITDNLLSSKYKEMVCGLQNMIHDCTNIGCNTHVNKHISNTISHTHTHNRTHTHHYH